jgi:hypothetical protein
MKYQDKSIAVFRLEHPGIEGGSMLNGLGTGRELRIVARETEEENRRSR